MSAVVRRASALLGSWGIHHTATHSSTISTRKRQQWHNSARIRPKSAVALVAIGWRRSAAVAAPGARRIPPTHSPLLLHAGGGLLALHGLALDGALLSAQGKGCEGSCVVQMASKGQDRYEDGGPIVQHSSTHPDMVDCQLIGLVARVQWGMAKKTMD